ncbi:MAG TPA: MFS transporter, partial [Alphaproteobacteria bacterium]|nr:MFS transporter [Alphaproteobacteria bacterium]
MNKALSIVLATVTLDAIGVGLVMPVLPALLRDLVHADRVAGHYGVLLSLYAVMQVFFAPVLGRLSDRFGRRPVLLVSLAGAAVDYAIIATAPVLWVLYAGRIVSGITGATGAVAGSCIADTTEGEDRARWFGLMGACYGGGMIAGPMIGGILGGISPHAPFMAAGLLNGLAFLMACLFLAETRRAREDAASVTPLNPLASLRMNGAFSGGRPLLGVFFIMQLVGQVPAAL